MDAVSYHRDKRLSVAARSILTWILGEPQEAINPENIAQENNLTVKYVRTLLATLAGFGYLNKPERVKGEHGHFEWTPYTLSRRILSTIMSVSGSIADIVGMDHSRYSGHGPSPLPEAMDHSASPQSEVMEPQAQNTIATPSTPAVTTSDSLSHVHAHTSTRDVCDAGKKSLLLETKDKSKRQRKKKKDSGYAGDVPTSNSPETAMSAVKVWNANHPAMQTAVVDAFKIKAGGFAGEIGKQLLGTSARGQRKQYAISPAMDPIEIVAFGQWYREMFYQPGKQCKAPTTAELLRDRVMQFRDDTVKRAKKLELAKGRLERLLNPTKKPDAPPVKDIAKLSAGDMVPVKEEEVEGLVKLGFMTADEMPRPTMKMINDRIAKKMGSN